jgi:hypothetical protein
MWRPDCGWETDCLGRMPNGLAGSRDCTPDEKRGRQQVKGLEEPIEVFALAT